jgi:hypothetical protein
METLRITALSMLSVVAPFMEVKLADILCTKPGVDVKKLFTDLIYEYY